MSNPLVLSPQPLLHCVGLPPNHLLKIQSFPLENRNLLRARTKNRIGKGQYRAKLNSSLATPTHLQKDTTIKDSHMNENKLKTAEILRGKGSLFFFLKKGDTPSHSQRKEKLWLLEVLPHESFFPIYTLPSSPDNMMLKSRQQIGLQNNTDTAS